ncbi:putative naringenin-chalcone synthase [Sphingomonas endophytica]|uniref:Putative naringenin-chalcone synthase n=1 Tax=Sphingomonas endophytica TaxID=869719 RepID=A0A7X0JB57_9SPHN|nr:type III polyketide synthase [Sphingomonas endophytica]MBB6503632.1 putative naringenin-chalcone synthase [Sphingomonas endophytica]
MRVTPHIAAIGTAVPTHDIHAAFVDWAERRLPVREARVFARMAARAGIAHRWSVLPAERGSPVGSNGFYAAEPHPGTGARMALYAQAAPTLALAAIADLRTQAALDGITHLVVASCTGFVAPGIDQIVARALELPGSVERVLIGFMGCYAAVAALRTARHIVRSEPAARVLVVTVELSTLHLQSERALEPLLAMLQFGDGAAAALVCASHEGLAIDRPFSATLPAAAELIRWDITDHGFAMHLSGEVPGRITGALRDPALVATLTDGRGVDRWAVHAGGRSILDAVEHALALPAAALDDSRAVLAANGNMSSATLMFVLARVLAGPPVEHGIALAFGPGLAAEGLAFASAA